MAGRAKCDEVVKVIGGHVVVTERPAWPNVMDSQARFGLVAAAILTGVVVTLARFCRLAVPIAAIQPAWTASPSARHSRIEAQVFNPALVTAETALAYFVSPGSDKLPKASAVQALVCHRVFPTRWHRDAKVGACNLGFGLVRKPRAQFGLACALAFALMRTVFVRAAWLRSFAGIDVELNSTRFACSHFSGSPCCVTAQSRAETRWTVRQCGGGYRKVIAAQFAGALNSGRLGTHLLSFQVGATLPDGRNVAGALSLPNYTVGKH